MNPRVSKLLMTLSAIALMLCCRSYIYSRGGGGHGGGGHGGGGFHGGGGGFHGGGFRSGGYHGGGWHGGGHSAATRSYSGSRTGRSYTRSGRGWTGGRGWGGSRGWGHGPFGWNRGFRGGWGWGWAWGWYGGLWLWGGWPIWWWQLYYPSYYYSYVYPMYVEIINQYPDESDDSDSYSDEDDDEDQTGEDQVTNDSSLPAIDPSKVKVLKSSDVPGLKRIQDKHLAKQREEEENDNEAVAL